MSTPLFCPLPWNSVAVRNDGVYRVCCHANVSGDRGVLKDQNGQALNASTHGVEDARNSDSLKKIRLDLLKGQWPASCQRCQREESVGLRSKRAYATEFFAGQISLQDVEAKTDAQGTITTETLPVQDMDLRFGNKCNLKCRMCGPSDSSSWYGDYELLNGRKFEPAGSFNWYENSVLWDSLKTATAGLEHVYVVGGEPLLIEQHYEFLQDLVTQGRAGQVVLEYNTNLTVLPQKALDLWAHFKQVRVGVSVDAFGKLNDYIRHPSRFNILERNLDRLENSGDNIVIWLASTVSILNLVDLPDLFLWKLQKGYKRINSSSQKPFTTSHVLHKPEFLNVQCLPAEMKAKVMEMLPSLEQKFAKGLTELNLPEATFAHYLKKWKEVYQTLTKHMNAQDLSEHFAEFQRYTATLDQARGEKLQDVISPEYYQILKLQN